MVSFCFDLEARCISSIPSISTDSPIRIHQRPFHSSAYETPIDRHPMRLDTRIEVDSRNQPTLELRMRQQCTLQYRSFHWCTEKVKTIRSAKHAASTSTPLKRSGWYKGNKEIAHLPKETRNANQCGLLLVSSETKFNGHRKLTIMREDDASGFPFHVGIVKPLFRSFHLPTWKT